MNVDGLSPTRLPVDLVELMASTKAIIFDLDGTLYTSPFLKISMAFHLRHSLPYLRKLEKARDAVRPHCFPGRDELLLRLATELNPHASDLARLWYTEDFYQVFVNCLNHGDRRPGLIPMLETLRSKARKIAVLSDYGWVEPRLRKLGIQPELFDALLSAEDCGALKPHSKSYLLLAERLKTDPAHTLVVGDRFVTDGRAAEANGFPYKSVKTKREWLELVKAVETL